MAGIVIKKPDSHKREYSFLELENGIKVIIASEPKCDKAGASLCVNVGMCHERKDLPGLAHFLEHMLFTGTTKYPKEGEYHEFIQQNGGMANAYTMCFFTNYMFEVKPDALEGALDRFSRFFYEPLLTRDCVEREINAVDSEFQGGSTQPWWRSLGILNMSANPEHPFHVACGNNKVLRDEPKERGIDLYDEMVKLYSACYSGNGMTLCVLGRQSVSELESFVKSMFAPVVNKGVTMPIGDACSDKPPFLPQDWNRLLLQNPVQDMKELIFSWVVPYQAPSWRSKPTYYIRHLLGHEGVGSVISVLKQKGIIKGCYAGDGAWVEGAFSLVNVVFELTDEGLEHIEEIGIHLFAFIGMLQKSRPERWIFDELSKLAEIQFKFEEDSHPFQLCQDVSLALQELPPAEVLSGKSQIYEFLPDQIESVLALLTLDSVRVGNQAKSLAERCTEKDTTYDSPMVFLPIEESWRTKWSAAVGTTAEDSKSFSASLGIHLPRPNPFIPEDLSLRELPAEVQQVPVALKGLPPPLAAVFHRQDDVLKQPKAKASFLLYTPFLSANIESYVKAELWCSCVDEALKEFSYDATVAGVGFAVGLGSGSVNLMVEGFNDKLGVLLDAVLEKILSMKEIPENVFSIVYDAYADDIRNAAFHSQPYSQCSMRFAELTSRGAVYPSYKRFETSKGITRESLSNLAAELFHASGCHVEALIHGNMTAKEAEMLCCRLVQKLKLEKPLRALPERAEAELPAGSTVWFLDGTDKEDPNHAVFMRAQFPKRVESDMLLQLLCKLLSPKYFDDLRTKQQLGYIVQMGFTTGMQFSYLLAMAQTEFPPDYVRSQISAFLQEHLLKVQDSLDEEEFATCRAGLLAELKVKHKTLSEECGRYLGHMLNRTYDFERRQRAIDFVENVVSSEQLKSFVRTEVAAAPRIFSQVKKQNPKQDKDLPEGASIPEDPPILRKWNTHVETVQSFASSAVWRPISSAVEPVVSRL
eukprot:TRINITY_DN3892_c0_g2_i1.p1 TRINITY_DN3892_c0_g2~~TRINITY_DN3892_c0_g2_i1.p1  ORF type:complete len:983 (+),score=151.68 TRINITY_DN3892_c0_g2_i1:148-3096(+)